MHDDPLPPVGLDPEAWEATIERIIAVTADRVLKASQEGYTMARVWIYRRKEQVEELGLENASVYVGFIDPDGRRRAKSCGPGAAGEKLAEQLKEQIHAELVTGTYNPNAGRTWEQFRREYRVKVMGTMPTRTRDVVETALDHFERICRPKKMTGIRAKTLDDFKAARRRERGRNPEDALSPATLNKDLRHLRAALRRARKWGYLATVPEFEPEREPKKLPRIMPPEHFGLLYRACDCAHMPAGQAYSPTLWWRALLTTCIMTGWRVGAVMALARGDVDLIAGTALTRHGDTKGKRDQLVPLHPVVVDHLKALPGFSAEMFPWPHDEKTLRRQLHRIERQAGIPCYGFHALKRSFCTLNAPRLEPTMLQYLAQHASFETTREHYINPAASAQEAVGKLYVPDVLRKAE